MAETYSRAQVMAELLRQQPNADPLLQIAIYKVFDALELRAERTREDLDRARQELQWDAQKRRLAAQAAPAAMVADFARAAPAVLGERT